MDDDQEMHEGMRFILGNDYDLTCVFSGKEALAAVASTTFPVVVLDLQMQGLSGVEILKLLLKNKNEPQKIIILTGNDTKESAIEALNHGAFRYLIKPVPKEQLLEALDSAFERYLYERETLIFPKQITKEGLQDLGLSERQAEIAMFSVQGERNQDIATHFKISERTVEKHLQAIFATLGVSSRAKLMAKINQMGAE